MAKNLIVAREIVAEVENLISEVKAAREVASELDAALKARKAEFEQANAELVTSLAAAKQAQSAAEIALRSWGEAEFLTTGNEKPAPGVGIRVSQKMIYEEAAAIDWSKENAPALILPMLDRKPFEAMMATRPAPFVSTENVVTVTIAANLE